MQVLGDVQATYRTFAVHAAGNSACFEQWALGVAEDIEVQHWLTGLPEPKRQPNLVFAAAPWHGLIAPAGCSRWVQAQDCVCSPTIVLSDVLLTAALRPAGSCRGGEGSPVGAGGDARLADEVGA